jgi:ABC-type antimicrobial peptide transport system permease subunit
MGFAFGFSITIAIDWEHILERTIETSIVSFFGGLAGTIAGLLVYFAVKKLNLGKHFHKPVP